MRDCAWYVLFVCSIHAVPHDIMIADGSTSATKHNQGCEPWNHTIIRYMNVQFVHILRLVLLAMSMLVASYSTHSTVLPCAAALQEDPPADWHPLPGSGL